MTLLKKGVCSSCGKAFANTDKVVVLIDNVEVVKQKTSNDVRLKLSKESITSRSIGIFCQKCLNLRNYGV